MFVATALALQMTLELLGAITRNEKDIRQLCFCLYRESTTALSTVYNIVHLFGRYLGSIYSSVKVTFAASVTAQLQR